LAVAIAEFVIIFLKSILSDALVATLEQDAVREIVKPKTSWKFQELADDSSHGQMVFIICSVENLNDDRKQLECWYKLLSKFYFLIQVFGKIIR